MEKNIKKIWKKIKIIFAGQKNYFIKLNPDQNFSYKYTSIIDPRIDRVFIDLIEKGNKKT